METIAMKLLITTQVVDKNDSHLGFFHRWIEEFAKHCEKITVICLKEGEHSLPKNVEILSLGKMSNSGAYRGLLRIKYAARFYKYIFSHRDEYDAVFVHMNPEYVVLGGLLWRLWHKKIVLWYTHKSVDLKLRVATFFVNDIATASKESFRLKSEKVHVMGHGIDTDFFTPKANVVRENFALSVGRLSKSKRHDLAIEAVVRDGGELRIVGEGPERKNLESFAQKLHANVKFLRGLTQLQLRDEYRKAAYLVHTSETGSLDKVVLEALACGLPVHTSNPALKPLETAGSAYVREGHSLKSLVPRILSLYTAK
jgi:glycosyltransferase involved in cell wall biosynthesis